ncbi:MAG: hypothetical protein IJA74_06050 [Oscillospiraceae bacterium]|nr:hypothetical protein [Oscillospiraceae bacterium]
MSTFAQAYAADTIIKLLSYEKPFFFVGKQGEKSPEFCLFLQKKEGYFLTLDFTTENHKKQGFFPQIQYKKRNGKKSAGGILLSEQNRARKNPLFPWVPTRQKQALFFFHAAIISHFFPKIFPTFSQPYKQFFELFVNLLIFPCKTKNNQL